MPDGYVKGKPDVSYWLQQIRKGLDYRKRAAYEASWSRWRQYYRGEWRDGVLPSNVFFKMLRTTVPRIYFQNPSISLVPTKPGLENAILAKLMERVDNRLLRTMGVKKQIKRMVQDAWMFGTGVGKKGFGSLYQATPQPFQESAPIDVTSGRGSLREYVEYNYNIQPNMPWFMRASPSTFITQAEVEYIEDTRWSCFVIRRPVGDVKADTRFKNAKDIGPTVSDFATGMEMSSKYPVDMMDLYEIRDKKTGKVFVICPQVRDRVLLFEDDEFARLKINVSNTLVFNEDDERMWGIPDSQMLEPLQLEINEIKTHTMYHRRLSILKILARRNSISEEEVAKLLSPEVGAVAFTEGDPNTSIKMGPTASDIPQGLLNSAALVEQDIRETLGFGRNQFGEYRAGSRAATATEADIVQQAANIRIDERRDMVADLLVEIVQDYHPLIFDHWSRDQVEEIIGPAGVPFWISFRPAMLQRTSYNVMADPDQSLPQTKELREAKALKLYQVLSTNPLIDPYKLTSYLLREMHGVAFDDMIRGLPTGTGLTPDQPLSIGQFGQVIQNVANKAPQLLLPGVIPGVGGGQ